VTEDPVVITTTGYTYDRKLLDKHVEMNGSVCPVSGEGFDPKENLVAVKANPGLKPRTTGASSVPGLLGLLQNEWDALMLEMHKLRKNYHSSREELSQTLYMHDAACRVVARLIRERDEAKTALSNLETKSNGAKQQQPQSMEVEASVARPVDTKKRDRAGESAAMSDQEDPGKKSKSGITQEVVAKMVQAAGKLSKSRRKKPLPEGLASLDDLKAYSLLGKYPLHTTSGSLRGITALDLDPSAGAQHLVTAGADGKFKIFDLDQRKAASDAIKAHSKAITCVKVLGKTNNQQQEAEGLERNDWALDLLGTCSADKTCKIWKRETEEGAKKPFHYNLLYTLSDHSSEVVGLAKQASGEYVVTFGKSGAWIFYDLLEGLKLCTTQAEDGVSFTCGDFHPDGLILGTGTAAGGSKANSTGGEVLIWDVKEQKSVANFQGHTGSITSLSFSENGYYLATASSNLEDGVKLWDLRKLKNFHTIDLAPILANQKIGKRAPKVVTTFDPSGAYLGVGCGQTVQVYGTKQQWQPLLGEASGFGDVPGSATKGASCLHFSANAKNILVGSSADHNLRIYGLNN
jgi:pre-mRNA-processing factor 19